MDIKEQCRTMTSYKNIKLNDMQTSKINFQEVRGFGDSITATFNFVKQEFKPLITSFAVIVLPWIFIDLFFKSYAVGNLLNISINPTDSSSQILDTIVNAFWSYLSSAFVYFWLFLYMSAYVRVYQEKYLAGNVERITRQEIWSKMVSCMGKFFLWGILYFLIVVIGTFLFIVPGIYLGVAFIFSFYFLVMRDKPVFESFSASMDLTRGNWWNTLGYIIILQLIVGALSYVFVIPYTFLSVKSMFTQEVPGVYEITFTLLLANLGQYFMQIIMLTGIAVRFFGLLEQREHRTLLSKIDRIGSQTQTNSSEETI